MLKRWLIGLSVLHLLMLFVAIYRQQAGTSTTEPQRLQQQIAPERLQTTNLRRHQAQTEAPKTVAIEVPTAATDPATTTALAPPLQPERSPTPPPEPQAPPSVVTRCWQVPGLSAAQWQSFQAKLNNQLPQLAHLWSQDVAVRPARWIVYTGKLANEGEVQKRRVALKALGVEFRSLNNPALEPGLALGTYSSEDAAQQALADVSRKGVKGARVAVERPELSTTTFKLRAVTDADKASFEALTRSATGKALTPC